MARTRPARANRGLILFVIIIGCAAAFEVHRVWVRHDRRVATAAPAIAANWPVTPLPTPTTRPALALALALATPGRGPLTLMSVANGAPTVNVTAPAVISSVSPLAQAKSQADGGDVLAARKTLNDALIANSLPPADAAAAMKQISAYNKDIVFSPRKFADDPFGGIYTVQPGQRLSGIAAANGVPWQLLAQLNNLSDPKKLRAGQHLKIIKGPLSVVVNKGAFDMDLYIGPPGGTGSMYLTSFPVGLGKSDSTPTGTWVIANKVRHPTYYSPRGEGVIGADDPKNPLGPCWLGLEGTNGKAVGAASYGIHGTIEPDSIGKMASMGCIRMHNEDVQVVFALLVEGKSTVIVKD